MSEEKPETPEKEPTLKDLVTSLAEKIQDVTNILKDHEKRISKLEREVF